MIRAPFPPGGSDDAGTAVSFAGHETTTGLIGNTVRRLLEGPERWSAVAADPRLIPGAVEETLRYDPSVPVWRRVTTRPVTLAGVDLPGAVAGRHLAFGKGLHYCLGANLGKLEAQAAVAALARRYPGLRLTPDQTLPFHPNIPFRGPQVLLVRP